MKTFKLLFSLAILCLGLGTSAQEIPEVTSHSPFTIGETLTFQSPTLREERKLNIYLPASYRQQPEKNYPVVYLLDGSADEDFIHIAGLVQFASFSWINQVPESIVVGIANTDRKRDFTYPSTDNRDQQDFPTSGGSARFISFLENEVRPLITKHYRTGTENTLIGQSLGGLLATEILYKRPDLFTKYIIVSPSLWWDNEAIITSAAAKIPPQTGIYIAVGKEGAVMERTARELFTRLKAEATDSTKIHFSFLETFDHGDALHFAVYQAFEKLYGKAN